MPDFEHDDFALFDWQLGQATHRRAFGGTFGGGFFKPGMRLQLAREAPPQRTPMIQRAISETAHAVTLRVGGRLRPLHQREKQSLQNILGFAMAKTQRAAIEDQLRRFGLVQVFAPIAHDFNG